MWLSVWLTSTCTCTCRRGSQLSCHSTVLRGGEPSSGGVYAWGVQILAAVSCSGLEVCFRYPYKGWSVWYCWSIRFQGEEALGGGCNRVGPAGVPAA